MNKKDKLNKIVSTLIKESTSKKQHHKWIQFKCECCGKNMEQLISRHGKSKNHFCSWDCMHEFRRKDKKYRKDCTISC